MELDRNGLEVLDRAEALRLLSHKRFGRVGVTDGALPTILPVNYWSDGVFVYVRTSAGTKLDAALRDAVVAFEVDDVDALDHAGWSVVVTGVAREVTGREELERLADAPLGRWAPSPDGHIIAISTEIVSGRRLRAMALSPAR
jgi:nitroimidazol reductase NimA-like FMN-containing flavoprotein (pyridoxamine 5'-phosphate oxidase superfamily)